MPVSLHADCRTRLVQKLTSALPSVLVNNGMFVNRFSLLMAAYEADEILPKNGRLRNDLNDYVGERPLLEFISGTLSQELRALDNYQKDTSSPVTEISGYENGQALAERLVAAFETLPWKYTFTIRLPESLATGMAPYVETAALSDTARLVKHNHVSIANFSLRLANIKEQRQIHGATLLSYSQADNPEYSEGIHFQFEDTGYVGLYADTNLTTRVEQRVRAFCGLALALQLATVNRTYGGTVVNPHYYVHRHDGAQWVLSNKIEIEDRYSRSYRDLNLNIPKNQVEAGTQQQWIDLILTEIGAVFSAGERAERLLLAAQWLFDSYSGGDELLSYVQAMVVLEILLGDKATSDEIGLGELLRNRCAYLIGQGYKEREGLLTEFNEIYAVRSQIVHRGKSKLNFRERTLFSRLHSICRRVIQKEVDLLRADKT